MFSQSGKLTRIKEGRTNVLAGELGLVSVGSGAVDTPLVHTQTWSPEVFGDVAFVKPHVFL